jgi:hypothetical protein
MIRGRLGNIYIRVGGKEKWLIKLKDKQRKETIPKKELL